MVLFLPLECTSGRSAIWPAGLVNCWTLDFSRLHWGANMLNFNKVYFVLLCFLFPCCIYMYFWKVSGCSPSSLLQHFFFIPHELLGYNSVNMFLQGEEEESEVCLVYYMPAYPGVRAVLMRKRLLGQGWVLSKEPGAIWAARARLPPQGVCWRGSTGLPRSALCAVEKGGGAASSLVQGRASLEYLSICNSASQSP